MTLLWGLIDTSKNTEERQVFNVYCLCTLYIVQGGRTETRQFGFLSISAYIEATETLSLLVTYSL